LITSIVGQLETLLISNRYIVDSRLNLANKGWNNFKIIFSSKSRNLQINIFYEALIFQEEPIFFKHLDQK